MTDTQALRNKVIELMDVGFKIPHGIPSVADAAIAVCMEEAAFIVETWGLDEDAKRGCDPTHNPDYKAWKKFLMADIPMKRHKIASEIRSLKPKTEG